MSAVRKKCNSKSPSICLGVLAAWRLSTSADWSSAENSGLGATAGGGRMGGVAGAGQGTRRA